MYLSGGPAHDLRAPAALFRRDPIPTDGDDVGISCYELAVPGPPVTRFIVLRDPPVRPSAGPLYRCGNCLASLPEPVDQPFVRCPACSRRNVLPARIWVGCARCGFEQPLSPRRLKCEPRCTSCAQVLEVPDLVLTPLQRHRRRHVAPGYAEFGAHRRRDRAAVLLLAFAAAMALCLRMLYLLR